MLNQARHYLKRQSIRYIINGVLATGVHFGALTFNLKILGLHSAGLANLLAAMFGIAVSFLGSRYFVFNSSTEALWHQIFRFLFLYLAIALLHGGMMYLWVDQYKLNYVYGFIVATIMQVVFSFWGNKLLVFKV